MKSRQNNGYTITDTISVCDFLFVLGENPQANHYYVTWESRTDSGALYGGQYYHDRLTALQSMCNRAISKINTIQQE